MTTTEVQEKLRQLQHAEDLAARAAAGPRRDELRSEIRKSWLAIKPHVTAAAVYGVNV